MKRQGKPNFHVHVCMLNSSFFKKSLELSLNYGRLNDAYAFD